MDSVLSADPANVPFPNAVIAGAPRSGTTSLFVWLADHPQVGTASVKETFFLMDPGATVDDRGRRHRDGLEAYRGFFKAVSPDSRVVLEATAGYLYQKVALETFATDLTEARLIFVVRRPADRLLSTYRYFSNNFADLDTRDIDFKTYVGLTRSEDASLAGNDFLRFGWAHGRYVESLARWRERCGAERVHVVTLESMKADRRREMTRLAAWLDIDPGFYETYGYPRENENYLVRNHALQQINQRIRNLVPRGAVREIARRAYRRVNTRRASPPDTDERATLEALDEAYAPSNAQLAEAFGMDLGAWSTPRRAPR